MAKAEISLTFFNSIESKSIEWLWYPYIPYGKITIVQGDPGEGKTSLVLSLIAKISNGEKLPCSDEKVDGITIYQNAEDDVADTIKPRLEKYSANCNKICFINSSEYANFFEDNGIEQAIIETKAKLLVLDPIQSFLGEAVDMNRATSVRPFLTRLSEIAKRTGCAIVLIGHLNKSSGNKANYRGLGSIDILAAARSVLLVGRTSGSNSIKVVAQQKNNLAPLGKSIAFQLQNGKVVWMGEQDITADDIVTCASVKYSKLDEAMEFLLNFLSDGMKPYKEIEENFEELNISKRTFMKAKAQLVVKSIKKIDGWYWELS